MEQHSLVMLTTDDWQAVSGAAKAALDADVLDPVVTERLLALKVVEFEFVDENL